MCSMHYALIISYMYRESTTVKSRTCAQAWELLNFCNSQSSSPLFECSPTIFQQKPTVEKLISFCHTTVTSLRTSAFKRDSICSSRTAPMPLYSLRFLKGLDSSLNTKGRPLMYTTGSSRMLCQFACICVACTSHDRDAHTASLLLTAGVDKDTDMVFTKLIARCGEESTERGNGTGSTPRQKALSVAGIVGDSKMLKLTHETE